MHLRTVPIRTGIFVDKPCAAQVCLALKNLNIRYAVPTLQSCPDADTRETGSNAGKPAIRCTAIYLGLHGSSRKEFKSRGQSANENIEGADTLRIKGENLLDGSLEMRRSLPKVVPVSHSGSPIKSFVTSARRRHPHYMHHQLGPLILQYGPYSTPHC